MNLSLGPRRDRRSRLPGLPGTPADGSAGDGAEAYGPATDAEARVLRSTRLRLMAVSGLVTFIILVLLGAVLYNTAATLFRVNSEDALRGRVQEVMTRGDPVARRSDDYTFNFGQQTVVYLVAPSGQVVAGAPPEGLPYRPAVTAAAGGTSGFNETTLSSGLPVRVYSLKVSTNLGSMVLQTAADRTQEVTLLHNLLQILLVGGFVALLASLVAGYMYAGRALIPIRASLVRQREALQRQREFTANASHELRTPLTVIRASVEDLRRNRRSRVEDVGDALGDIDAEVSHLTALVEDLLLLARTDSGVVQVERLPVDLADVAADAASALASFGEEHGVRVVLDPLPAPIVGDPLRLRQLVTILVDNAIRHGGRGSEVIVHVKGDDGGGALLGVEDEGPGIKPEDLPRVFDRFWRADTAPAGGTGLGLAIAKWIVEQHGGSIVASNRPEGGARFLVRLPAGEALAEDDPEVSGSESEPGDRAERGAPGGASAFGRDVDGSAVTSTYRVIDEEALDEMAPEQAESAAHGDRG